MYFFKQNLHNPHIQRTQNMNRVTNISCYTHFNPFKFAVSAMVQK